MSELAVQATGVGKVFNAGRPDQVDALTDVDLTVAPGEFVSLIGPSGCGKSTLLRLIADLLDTTTGQLFVNGKTPRQARLDQDYGRMGRQQEVILALVSRLVDPETDVDLAQLLDGLESLDTDLPTEDLRTLVEIARRAQDATVTRELVDPPDLIVREGDLGDGRGYILVPDVEAIRALVTSLIPPAE